MKPVGGRRRALQAPAADRPLGENKSYAQSKLNEAKQQQGNESAIA